MWVSDKWDDYELLDCSRGERLERWGKFRLIRPDPQVIWNTERQHPDWKSFDARYIRSQSGGGSWEMKGVPERWGINYRKLSLNVRTMNFKHTGVFPEQAVNWDYLTEKITSSDRKLRVLCLFAYTGAASIAAANAGAEVCHVDAAKGMVSWAKENAASTGLKPCPIRWIVDDCVKFVRRELRRGCRYDAIIMDPPSYGRGPGGEIWRLEDNLWDLLMLCVGLLSENPLFIIINSYTAGLNPASMSYICNSVLESRFGGVSISKELGLPVTQSGLVLPCGASCRWEPGS